MMRSLNDKADAFRAAYDDLGSIRSVARRFRCSPNTVRAYLRADQRITTQQTIRNVIIDDDHLIGLYVGLWMGDGTQYREKSTGRYTIKLCTNRDDGRLNALIQDLILRLFGKTSFMQFDRSRSVAKGAVIKLYSKFIFEFIYRYIIDDTSKGLRKAHTVRLRHPLAHYSQDFLNGCLLGLILSDGCLSKQLHFHSTSPWLIENVTAMLSTLGFHPSVYVRSPLTARDRELHMLWLGRPESRRLELLFDSLLQRFNPRLSYRNMKMSPP